MDCSFEANDAQILQCVQLYNTLAIRHGVVIMGAAGSGKSTVIQLLRRALNLASNTIQTDRLKALSLSSNTEVNCHYILTIFRVHVLFCTINSSTLFIIVE